MSRLLWAPQAWVDGRWQDQVLLEVDGAGCWARIVADQPCPPHAERLAGPGLPGLVDAHSHAFQRAFAGLSERREQDSDDFWSWRDRMYRVAGQVSVDEVRDIATHLFHELIEGGYTQVCEFHYLQHQADGQPHADPLAMAWALRDSARASGIGLTLLPVLYERAGFRHGALRPDQARFRLGADEVWSASQRLRTQADARFDAGLAIHSLRGAAPESIHRLAHLAAGWSGAIHIHVAEQTGEVDDCLAATGRRPIEWLLHEQLLDARWQLVHATHATPAEVAGVAASGAGVVICPGTEADLGDGLTDLSAWLAAGVPVAVGSDSQVTRDWREELRWLEWGQRLARRQRNLAADPARSQPATAARLFEAARQAGAAAAGLPAWGLTPGARADLLVMAADDPALTGIPASHRLDALVFSAPTRPWRDVMVAGTWVRQSNHQPGREAAAERLAAVMQRLWQSV
ncbi:formimidoylglutamate deiminase [Ideonella sp. 4Y16]|uniref:Formimidoylglutamate deiminase n=1 Tax=Ideonella alba TaxID=2824118 RepID=A0A940Y6V5_9BURK|nr:formimidoylglutamate deiminase [Ideonella alba]MBQ0929863.1 formimidoylglutamate deiminase [Ideonella alba]MBQ0942096.1 formimidoylglutamate deiminase [Ideonella alba]